LNPNELDKIPSLLIITTYLNGASLIPDFMVH